MNDDEIKIYINKDKSTTDWFGAELDECMKLAREDERAKAKEEVLNDVLNEFDNEIDYMKNPQTEINKALVCWLNEMKRRIKSLSQKQEVKG